MHFDILVEDFSGKEALNVLVPKIKADKDTFTVKSYKGVGRLPKNLKASKGGSGEGVLLNNLPKLIQGYGKTYKGYPDEYKVALIIVCDLDNKCLKEFRTKLDTLLNSCNIKPETRFCIAVQEIEAWYLGDLEVVKAAYGSAKVAGLSAKYDESNHGTWEQLADIIFKGGAAVLSAKSWSEIGEEKSKWARNICPHLDIAKNTSPSFIYFRDTLLELTGR